MSVPVEDRLEVQELVARYSIARDDKDLDALLGCFVEDAVFRRRGQVVEGRAAIRDFFLASMRRYELTTHTNHAQVLDPGPDEGQLLGLVTGHAELVLDAQLVVASYRYHDRYSRTSHGWRIADRSLSFLYALPVTELGAGFADRKRIRWPGQEPAEADYPETLPTWWDVEPNS